MRRCFVFTFISLNLITGCDVLNSWDFYSRDPQKYYSPYIDDRVRDIKDQIGEASEHSYAFYYITDTHPNQNYGNSGFLLTVLASQLPINDLFFGGDVGTSTSTKWGEGYSAREALLKSDSANTAILHSVKPFANVYRIKGNHDYSVADADFWRSGEKYKKGDRVVYRPNEHDDGGLWECVTGNSDDAWTESHWKKKAEVSGYTFNATESYQMIMRDVVSNGDAIYPNGVKGCFYFVDRPDAKLRLICMDTCDTDMGYYGISNVFFGISDEQFNWVANTALLTTPAEYDVLFFFHIPININATLSQDYVNRKYAKELRDLFEAVNNKCSVLIRGCRYDFSNFKPDIKLVINGHTHSDLITKTNGYFAISCSADYYDSVAATSPIYTNLGVPTEYTRKKKGTIREQAFDVVLYDASNSQVKFFRIGQGVDRCLNLIHYQAKVGIPFSFESSLEAEPLVYYCYDANSNVFSSILDNYTYSQSLASVDSRGVVTPIAEGEIVLSVYDPDKNIIEISGITIVN